MTKGRLVILILTALLVHEFAYYLEAYERKA
jgi:hypothetical protein